MARKATSSTITGRLERSAEHYAGSAEHNK